MVIANTDKARNSAEDDGFADVVHNIVDTKPTSEDSGESLLDMDGTRETPPPGEKSDEDPSISYFVFGHRHLAYDITLNEKTHVICLGDWIVNFTYGVFDGSTMELKQFLPDRGEIVLDRITS